ncbi:uncharacterized protein LOC128673819 [Plodia interpunctella]|uniref:uncharacterized protein LOC128673819 n=1 Tax=Plodia interpunctella TaxID=58824 RepID=UPI002368E891|nr:uncharacterized protein LOC128673819 isoform X2 [Plodia interpunctella]XP_053607915.1 uncharacterized protein LOC128673819 isoform X2 [Plodia interpunctella]
MAGAAPTEKPYYDVNEAGALFEQFMKDNNRNYKDEEDKRVHYEAFKANLVKINELNAKSDSATFGINKFADYTESERKNMFGLRLPSSH